MTKRRAVEVENVVRRVVEALVDDPSQTTILLIERDYGIHFIITAPSDDIGRLIGRDGRTARAIRTLTTLLGSKNKELYTVEITTPFPT